MYQGKSGECAAFLVNTNSRKNVTVQFQNSSYELPPRSISILPDCKTVAFNTAKACLASALFILKFIKPHSTMKKQRKNKSVFSP